MKAKAQSSMSKAQGHMSFDVSYAEIMAEVQKLQKMLDGNLEKKPRKKRTLKTMEENQINPEIPTAHIKDEDSEQETKTAKNRYKVSNLDEIREKISEVKELIQEVAPNAEAEAAVLVADEEKANESESKIEPESEAKADASIEPEQEKIEASSSTVEESANTQPSNDEPEQAEIFQATQEVVEANADSNPQVETAISSDQNDEPTVGKAEAAAETEEVEVKEAKVTKPKATKPRAKAEPKAKAKPKAKETEDSSLDAYFIDSNSEVGNDKGLVGLAAKRHAEELAKHDIKDEKEIVKANLSHDKSGAEWGGTVNLEEDPDLEHPQS